MQVRPSEKVEEVENSAQHVCGEILLNLSVKWRERRAGIACVAEPIARILKGEKGSHGR